MPKPGVLRLSRVAALTAVLSRRYAGKIVLET
jgi:hypothetical protein